jgi:hypothetical protein
MRNQKILSVALLIAGLVTVNCSSGTTRTKTEGWVNDDTLRVRGIGAPNPNREGKVQRETQACDAAQMAAQARILEMMVGASIEGASGSMDGESTGVALTKEFGGTIKGGDVIERTVDDEQNCEIWYEIKEKNLRKKMKVHAQPKK